MGNKINLLYCPGIYPCKIGGMEIYYYHLIENIENEYKNDKWIVLTACKALSENRFNYLPLKNKIFGTSRFGLGAFSTILYYFFSKDLNWNKIDNIIIPYTSNFYPNIIPFVLLNYLFKIPYTIHIHGGGMKSWRFSFIQKYFFRNAENVFGVSSSIVKEYSIRSKIRVKNLPPLIPFKKCEINRKQLKLKNKLLDYEQIILFVGSMKPLKAPNILLEAFNNLGKEFITKNKVCLLFAGDGILLNDLSNYIRKNNLDDNVKLLGKIDNKYISEYYALSDIFVISSWFEGMPISLLEAKFNKMLCVGTNVNGINNIITHNSDGLLFEKDNSKELSKLLKMVILNEVDVEQFKENAKRNFDLKFDYKEHLEYFNSHLN